MVERFFKKFSQWVHELFFDEPERDCIARKCKNEAEVFCYLCDQKWCHYHFIGHVCPSEKA